MGKLVAFFGGVLSASCYYKLNRDSGLWSNRALRWSWGWNEKDYTFINWHHSVSIKPKLFSEPYFVEDVERLLEMAVHEKRKIRVVGAGCSPNKSAFCDDIMISLRNMKKIKVFKEKRQIFVEAGATFHEINKALHQNGLGMFNLTSISEQTIGGAISFAIHGTGISLPSLASCVDSFTLVTPSEGSLFCSSTSNPEIFYAGIGNLGVLGVVTSMTLNVEDAFKLRACQEPSTLQKLMSGGNLETLLQSNRHFRFWWFPHTDHVMQWSANKVSNDTPNKNLGDRIAKQEWYLNYALETALLFGKFFPPISVIANKFAANFFFNSKTEIVNWSPDVFNFDCLFRQYVSEWAIDRKYCFEALEDLQNLIKRNPSWAVNFPVEVRFSAPDKGLLAPGYGRETCWIGIIMYKPFNFEPNPYWKTYFSEFQNIMEKYDGRPHWAKAGDLNSHQLEKIYPRYNEFCELRQRLDKDNIFLNDLTSQWFQK